MFHVEHNAKAWNTVSPYVAMAVAVAMIVFLVLHGWTPEAITGLIGALGFGGSRLVSFGNSAPTPDTRNPVP